MSVQTWHVPSHHGASMMANAAIATPKRKNSKIPATVNERSNAGVDDGGRGGVGGGRGGGDAEKSASNASNEEWPKWAWSIGIKGKLNKQIYKESKVYFSLFDFHS